jgi:uncharacterized protein (DUF488 family)
MVDEIFTVGHSNLALDALIAALRRHRVAVVADVRAFPGSRRHPQFAAATLSAELPRRGICYRHFRALGGRRRVRPDSPNGGWEVEAFRAYADYALTPEFAAAFGDLTRLARAQPVALMCAEGVWWRCHRRLIADRLAVAGWTVRHIRSDGGLDEHRLPPFAVPQRDGTVLYPGTDTLPL